MHYYSTINSTRFYFMLAKIIIFKNDYNVITYKNREIKILKCGLH